MKSSLQTTPYGHVVTTSLGFEAAVERVTALLKEEGFGVLCDIDVTKAMHEKLGKDFSRYRILCACNPALAYQALGADPHLGLLLPCNFVVQTLDNATIVSAIVARAMMSVTQEPALMTVATEVDERITRVMDRVAET